MKLVIGMFFFLVIYGCNHVDFSGTTDKSPSNYIMDYGLEVPNCEDDRYCQNYSSSEKKSQVKKKRGHLTENFRIVERTGLEVIWDIDASQSMDDNLIAVGDNLTSFLSNIQDKDWRMAFITADHGDHLEKLGSERWEDYDGKEARFGKFMSLERSGKIWDQKILHKDVFHYAQIFQDTLTRRSPGECSLPPFCHQHNEQPLRALKAAIERVNSDPIHQDFFKPNTDTVVIIITDEDERRHDFKNATTAEDVIQTYLTQFRGLKKRLFGFSISIQDASCLNRENNRKWLSQSAATYGRMIARLAELTGGQNISLCSEHYGDALADISQRTQKLIHSVTLQKLFYIPDTVKVKLIPNQPDVSWKIYGRSLVFSDNIQPGTKIRVGYNYEE